jgi:hypothetical protein
MHKIIISCLTILFTLGASLCFAENVTTEDKNKDGKPDVWTYYDSNKRPIKIESDRNYDGKVDLWITYGEKGQRQTDIDLNFDGRPDRHSYYLYGQRVKMEIDIDYDGKLDQVSEYSNTGRLIKLQKAGKDGNLETVFDISDKISSQQKNTQYYETYPKPLGDSKALPEKQKAQ